MESTKNDAHEENYYHLTLRPNNLTLENYKTFEEYTLKMPIFLRKKSVIESKSELLLSFSVLFVYSLVFKFAFAFLTFLDGNNMLSHVTNTKSKIGSRKLANCLEIYLTI